jgi:hypothetical protein
LQNHTTEFLGFDAESAAKIIGPSVAVQEKCSKKTAVYPAISQRQNSGHLVAVLEAARTVGKKLLDSDRIVGKNGGQFRENGGQSAGNQRQNGSPSAAVLCGQNGRLAAGGQSAGKQNGFWKESGQVFLSREVAFFRRNFHHHYAT